MTGPRRPSAPLGDGPPRRRPGTPRPGRGASTWRRHRRPPAPGLRARTSLTGRAAVLGLVVCALALTLAYPLRGYLAQRSQIAALQERVAAQQQRVAALEEADRRWADPAYVKARARERLHYVMPGETQYVVLEPDEAPAPAGGGREAPAGPDRPWFTRLWQSVEGAARAGG